MNWWHTAAPRISTGVILMALCLFRLAQPAESAITTPSSRSPITQDSAVAARRFEAEIDRFIDILPVKREFFEVRVSRCENPSGRMRDDIYAIWIGARLVVKDDNADVLLDGVRADWIGLGWEITRDRRLKNGGVNLAAVNPATGVLYSLDSGFAPHPKRHMVGHFSTPCFRHTLGTAPFGRIDLD